jgi:hypothetical protein
MKKILYHILTITLSAFLFTGQAYADKVHGEGGNAKKSKTNARSAAGCIPAKSATDLDLNNVRARINTGGDMWWDLQGIAQYEIPKGSTKTSMFSASLWLGGTDVNGQLKGAFQRYRGNGNDYWPGPLSDDGKAAVDQATCSEYDKHFVIYREQVDEFIEKFGKTSQYPDYVVPKIIQEWPAHGNTAKHQNFYLAPFVDVDGNGVYEWQQGDYPYYDIDNSLCRPKKNSNGEYYYEPTMEGNGILADQVLKGDQTLWWVFNDNGNIHTESNGNSIGVEIRAQAFAFSTNDEINNMTFYTYEIINRSSFRLTETYFSQWVDTDLGYAYDDYVGCDVQRGLGYCYNGTQKDGLGKPDHYGNQPPAVGVDFFQGPYMDADGIDNPKIDVNGNQLCDESINGVNFGDSIIDNERFGMRKFVYHNNVGGGSNPATTDPQRADEYYQLLRGIWKDGVRMHYGGNAHPASGGTGPECDFMFPDLTDPCNWGTGGIPPSPKKWTEQTAGNKPYDRRFMQSAGPFTLESGAVNYITVGIPWARASSGGPFASVELLRKIDDKAQALFDNCFKVLDGPDAPELIVQELDKTIILYLENIPASNNAKEDYEEEDVTIPPLNDTALSPTRFDSTYNFQGYQIFQLRNSEVTIADIRDPDKARLVAQCDLKDDVGNLVNYVYDEKLGGSVPHLMVEAENKGIRHSFMITEDKFASGDPRLVNNKKYYYVAIAYAFNEYMPYSQNPDDINGLYGQKKPYLAGRKAAVGPIRVQTAIPHIPDPEAEGTIIHSSYGDGPKITRVDGRGNGGNELELTEESFNTIFEKNTLATPEYTNGHGPIKVKVIDPLRVEAADYTLKFIPAGDIDTAHWVLFKNGDVLDSSLVGIGIANEQLFLDEGISVEIGQAKSPGTPDIFQNGVISATINYQDSSHKWLGGVPDIDNGTAFNWIRSGTLEDKANTENNDYDPGNWLDPEEQFEKLIGRTWAPYRMASKYEDGPAGTSTHASYKLSILESVDVVFTSDKSKWTRCVVIETGDDPTSSEGGRPKLQVRDHTSIDKDGNFATPGSGASNNPEDPNYISDMGMGWFPGYAISVETGERLNIMYGESSWLVGENGADMQFNPTTNFQTPLGDILFGGKHFLYILRHSDNANGCPAYDGGKWILQTLGTNANAIKLMKVHSEIMWTSIPMAKQGEKWLDNDVRISLRVTHPYKKGVFSSGSMPAPNNSYPMYTFNTGDLAVQLFDQTQAENALDLIRVVPNPYYAFSSYEENQLDNRVKITNLPERCTISIYSTNGILVRRFKKDETNTFLDWDLKNHANIPIASGIYYIHIDAPGIGEKVIKWFGVLRPVDLNAF